MADELRVPFADHMLVTVPADVPPLPVAAASDNLADAWRSVVTSLRDRPGGSVLIIGGGAKSIGLYAAGLAVAHGATVVHYVDDDPARRRIAEACAHTFPARARSRRRRTTTLRYDIFVEASSRAASHARAVLPDLLAFVARTRYPAEQVTTVTAHWEDAPTAYVTRTTKLVLQRDAV